MMQSFLDGRVELRPGDCRDRIKEMPDNSIDAVVTDPPYALVSIQRRFGGANAKPTKDGDVYSRSSAGFMGKQWDTGETAFAVEFWAEVLRVLKPGGHVVAFSGTRTYHRMACAIEDAGFEIRDQIGYLYGSGFPKSHNVSRKLDDIRCSCSGCETTAQVLQHNVRPVRNADVSQAECSGAEFWKVLQQGVPEQGAPTEGREQLSTAEVWCGESGVEGRCDAQETTRELRVGEVRPLSTGSDNDGSEGRLHNGASSCDGEMGGAPPDQVGGRASCGPRSAEQSTQQLGTLAGQQEPQNGRAWPNCGRCGKPIIPEGVGTALKPAWEPICLARKPLAVPQESAEGETYDADQSERPVRWRSATVAENVLEHGTGALNIDGCRVGKEGGTRKENPAKRASVSAYGDGLNGGGVAPIDAGRWPANIVHDGSDEVVSCFPETASGCGNKSGKKERGLCYGQYGAPPPDVREIDSGSAARFFYSAKADKLDRVGSKHPTVKPVDLMQWLVRLVTPKGGLVLDPFAGSGSTGEAAWREGMRCILIEREEEYQADIARRMELAAAGPTTRKAAAVRKPANDNDLPLFRSAA